MSQPAANQPPVPAACAARCCRAVLTPQLLLPCAPSRHTKHQVLGGEEVLQLPPKSEAEVAVVLGPEERQLYLQVHKEAKVGGGGGGMAGLGGARLGCCWHAA